MNKLAYCLLPAFLGAFLFFSCQKEKASDPVDSGIEAQVAHLRQVLHPLPTAPLDWADDALAFLDPSAQASVVALGEATHGTAEFFEAKFRIFRYLVERHGFKTFAFEADFGESLLIDQAIQEGRTADIEPLMGEVMHFWTWRTEEVRQLLEWMSEYNRGKAPAEKIHYVGVDCQYNTFHPGMLEGYLERTEAPFLISAREVLDEARLAADKGFGDYDDMAFAAYTERLTALRDSMQLYREVLIDRSGAPDFQLYYHFPEVIRQVSRVNFARQQQDNSRNYRDEYMADNTLWWLDRFAGEKIVLWAHNGHIADNRNYGRGGSQGRHLRNRLGGNYSILGFLFSTGSFTAVTQNADQFAGLNRQTITAPPLGNSINARFREAGEPAFAVSVAELDAEQHWRTAFLRGLQFFQVGAVFNNMPTDYYAGFVKTHYDWLIYFNETTASTIIQR